VIPEVILSPERLAADITGIGPLVRVCPFVDEQIVRLGELSIAELADELLFGPGGATRSSQQTSIESCMHSRAQTRWEESCGGGGSRGKGKAPGSRGRRTGSGEIWRRWNPGWSLPDISQMKVEPVGW